jgi:hypothetical protein
MSNSFYGKPTASELRGTGLLDPNGLNIDFEAENAVNLTWSRTQDNLVVSGSSDVVLLTGLRGALLKLKD